MGLKCSSFFFALFSLAIAGGTMASQQAQADNLNYPAGYCADPAKIRVSSAHLANIGGATVNYTATVGALETHNETAPSYKACLFYTSYVVAPTTDARPLIFAFNGGPGSASLWLHMGALGPMRVDMGPEGLTQYTPAHLVNNDNSFLGIADVVMIDPIGTGFSQVEGVGPIDNFIGAQNDYQSVARFIANYISQNNRELSPIFVLGESYGGIRGSLLANHLQSDYGVNLSGLILVSPWLSSLTTNFGEKGNNYPYAQYFPNFATTAWYHKRMAQKYLVNAKGQALSVSQIYDQAKAFSETYLTDLDAGNKLPPNERDALAQTMSDMLGIDKEAILNRYDLRIQDVDFFGAVLGKPNWIVGRYDARYMGQGLASQTGDSLPDPSDTKTNGPFSAATEFYLRDTLGFQTTAEYVASANFVNWPFNDDTKSVQVIDDLAKALNYKQGFRVFIASGFYDLACPMATVDYALSQIDPSVVLKDPQGRDRIVHGQYEGGHMMYLNPAALTNLKKDLTSWIQESSSEESFIFNKK